ncbi:MAG TPA: peptidylprolyl isomerase [Kiritimatiellia bacterium]|jgi:peptidyl-prolyl cis-trans isomerase C|nr:peptidylprolyl isomerase [Kiritimatiellia bacterium]HPK37173.1 peptidylprolyl isomerase [Kiritimatiellia bacterium]HRU19248.1 peptidylprolyl isomerase [Kiritimatiellia bacterium]
MKTVKVNGQRISEEAIQFELERLVRFHAEHGMAEDQVRAQLPALVDKAIDQAIGAKLLLDEASRLDIPVREEDVEAQIARIIEQVGGEDAFRKALTGQNTTEQVFRDQIRRGCRVEKLVEQAVAGVAEPTEEDIRRHFDEHKEEYAPGERVLAQHILISPDGDTQTSKNEARAKIEAIRERIQAGKSFSDEAAAHSMCPSGKDGGSLGWFSRGMMVPEFDSAAFSMNVGEVSDVIETQFGYHIIFKTDHEAAGEADFDQVREKIRDFLRHARRGEAMAAYVNELKSKAKIEVE